MKKRGVRVSKTLLKAQLLSLLALVLAGIAIIVVVMHLPGSPWAKVWEFIKINNQNPAVFFSDYYQNLEAQTNQQDWLIFSPISFLVGGLVFGAVLTGRQKPAYIAKSGAITGIIWSALSLVLSTLGPVAEANNANQYGYHLPQFELSWRVAAMGVLQTVYWTVFFVIGSQVAFFAKQTSVKPGVGNRTPPTIPAASNE